MDRFLARLADYLRHTRRGVGPLIDAIAEAGYGPPDTYLQIISAGARLMRGEPERWNRLTKQPKPGAHHLRSYSFAGEAIPSCNDYPMIWDKYASEPDRRAQLEASIENHDPNTFKPFTPREVALSSHIGYLYCLTFPKPTALYEPPATEDARPTDAPVLVVSGEMDDVTTPHEGQRVADEFPNSKWVLVRNAGHVDSLYHENGRAAKAIRGFLSENLPA
jgi:pimeloyl-ACP methyl ester carboxylesterase